MNTSYLRIKVISFSIFIFFLFSFLAHGKDLSLKKFICNEKTTIYIFESDIEIPGELSFINRDKDYRRFEGWLDDEYVSILLGHVDVFFNPNDTSSYYNAKLKVELIEEKIVKGLNVIVYKIRYGPTEFDQKLHVVIYDDREFLIIKGSYDHNLWHSILESRKQ